MTSVAIATRFDNGIEWECSSKNEIIILHNAEPVPETIRLKTTFLQETLNTHVQVHITQQDSIYWKWLIHQVEFQIYLFVKYLLNLWTKITQHVDFSFDGVVKQS